MHDLSTTIVAVATPPGRGGVGCLRISGAAAVEIAKKLFRPRGREPEPGGRPSFGRFLDRDSRPLDHGYLVVFGEGASYSGELTVEAWTHGSPAVLDELVQAAVTAGAVVAGPGEFTYRALRHARLDLTRAEAVRDLIAARTLYQARVAWTQADGSISRRLTPLRELLEEWIARGEAAVEFVEEDATHLSAGGLHAAIDEAATLCDELLAGFERGRVVRDGAQLAIIGRPNAGKSSLFNRLLERDRAIVAETAGTTRDTLEEELHLRGVPLRLIDTAGLRAVDDPVESEGVRRAHEAREEADLVLLVLDGSRELEPDERQAIDQADERTVIVANKCDLEAASACDLPQPEALQVSAVTGAGLEELRSTLGRRLLGSGPIEDPIITNSRHARALEMCREALGRAAEAGAAGLSEELLLEDLREAMLHLGSITGEFTGEELYDRIFSTFCIGK